MWSMCTWAGAVLVGDSENAGGRDGDKGGGSCPAMTGLISTSGRERVERLCMRHAKRKFICFKQHFVLVCHAHIDVEFATQKRRHAVQQRLHGQGCVGSVGSVQPCRQYWRWGRGRHEGTGTCMNDGRGEERRGAGGRGGWVGQPCFAVLIIPAMLALLQGKVRVSYNP